MNHTPTLRFLTLLCIVLVSCAIGSPSSPRITQDSASCARCRAMVHDLRYAAAFNDGNERIFDDIGCMLSTVTAEGHEPKAMWVMDYQRYAWLDAHHAVYVYAPKLGTPRNYGFIAVGSIEAAQRLARSTDGQVLDGWDQVVAFFKARV